MNEFDLVRAIAEGKAQSPVQIGDAVYAALRITGTGASWRDNEGYIYRPSEHYINGDFLSRCNGLSVIVGHPNTQNQLLDVDSFENQSIGSIVYPYLNGSEVWGIAKLYTDIDLSNLSTSPHISTANNNFVDVGGVRVLAEGEPVYLDHLAICTQGVWDKLQPDNKGILITNEVDMTEEEAQKQAEQEELLQKPAAPDASEPPQAAPAPEPAPAPAPVAQDNGMASAIAYMSETLNSLVGLIAAQAKPAEAPAPVAEAKPDELPPDAGAEAVPQADETGDPNTINEIENKMAADSLTDYEQDEKYELQAQADSVFNHFGKRASQPGLQEKPHDYLKRIVNSLKQHSPAFKGIKDLGIFDADTLKNTVAPQVFADSIMAAEKGVMAEPGQVIKRVRNEGGRTRIDYLGQDASVMTAPFKAPTANVVEFNLGGK